MNRCHKILQDIYYSLHAPQQFDDDINGLEHVVDERTIVFHCLQQLYEEDAPLTFPSKSYNVAVIYARLLEHHFKRPALEFLQDPTLLRGDLFYKPYSENPELYDYLLDIITYDNIQSNERTSVKKTVAYFNQEFMVGSCEFMLMTKEAKVKRK